MDIETKPLSWFIAQRRHSVQQEVSEQKAQTLREDRQKRAKEQKQVRDLILENRKLRISEIKFRETLSSFNLIRKSIQKTRKHLSELEDGDKFIRLLDEIQQKTFSLEKLVSSSPVKDIANGSENSEEIKSVKIPRVV